METNPASNILTCPSFGVGDSEHWLPHLEDEGWVVVRGVLPPSEVAATLSLFWDWAEGLNSGIVRNDASTWRDANWPGTHSVGFFSTHGGAHSAAAWHARSHPSICDVFARIWKTEDLLTSMDTFIGWRPWWKSFEGEDWRPRVERLHVDQSPLRPGFRCVQGMLVLRDVDPSVGGLQFVPRSHTPEVQQQQAERYPRAFADWCQLKPDDPFIGCGRLVEAQAGDLILWDSRLIHGGFVGPGPKSCDAHETSEGGLARHVLTVCMLPRHEASARALEGRRRALAQGLALSHWPSKFEPHGFRDSDGGNIPPCEYVPPALTERQMRLVA
eukprot:NODE_2401_length_1209_cov_14.089655_g2190_i0.p1 GENE.NODE_2401_length_1209_cov_14.089655_g2190_i0~~NODE_2401_length_1209_cov_14.089655_g2190_i0.p1  ORF type:complete len:354 (-),score=28.87 NODE_2401_length_1209_cov_14.089655_g2190_i0:146-1129(-)